MILYDFLLIFVLPFCVALPICIFFIDDDSHFQKAKLHTMITSFNRAEVFCKNKPFVVEIQRKKINYIYCYYEIFINDKLAATFHQMDHVMRSSYRFRAEGDRLDSEVRYIIKAAYKQHKKQEAESITGTINSRSYFN